MKYLLLAFVMTLSCNLFSADNVAPKKQPQRSSLMSLWDGSMYIGASTVNSAAIINTPAPVIGFGAVLLVTAAVTAPLANHYFNRNKIEDHK
jgi:hypothetical protein